MKTPAFLVAESASIAANRAKTRVSIAHDLARQVWVVAAIEAKHVGNHEDACFAIMCAAGHAEVARILYLKGKSQKRKAGDCC